MNTRHVIADEVLDATITALSKGEHWMAYNGSLYFIDVKDVHFFKEKQEALDFASDNYSDHDRFNTIQVDSVEDVLRKVRFSDIFNEEKIQYVSAQKENNISSSLNQTKMNTENQTYLKDNIKYMGFGEKQNEALEQHLMEGKESFQLTINTEVNKKAFEATLNFRKSDNSDMYFFNSYHANLQRSNGEKKEQTFYLHKGKGVTAKEAYNLLEGRSVHKELTNKAGVAYKAWIQLDFDKKDKNNNFEVKQYHENFGYDVKAAVGKYAVAELDGGEKEKALIQSLQKGNIQSVTIEKDGATHKMFIEANPQYKSVHLYDGQMKMVQKEVLEQYQSHAQTQAPVVKQEQSNKPDIKQEKTNLKAGKKITNDSLLPKKRIRQKKGLGVS
jgi:hypothetical protein